MMKSILKLGLLGLFAIAVAEAPAALHAQDTVATNKPAAKPHAVPFHGKLKSVDNTAKTISVGTLTIQIMSETRINKDGKPAMLADGVVGENVSGLYKKTADGKSEAVMVNFGQKAKAAAPASNTKTNKP